MGLKKNRIYKSKHHLGFEDALYVFTIRKGEHERFRYVKRSILNPERIVSVQCLFLILLLDSSIITH